MQYIVAYYLEIVISSSVTVTVLLRYRYFTENGLCVQQHLMFAVLDWFDFVHAILLWTSWAASDSTYKMSTLQSPVSLRLLYTARIDGLFLHNGKRKSDDFKRMWALEQTS